MFIVIKNGWCIILKNSVNSITNYFFSRKYTLLIISYLILGCFFVSFEYANREYFDIFLGTLTNEKFTIIFLFPSFLALYNNLFNFLDNWNEVIIRFKNRKEYTTYHLKFILKTTVYFFMISLLILGIFCNFMPKTGNGLTSFQQYQNVSFIYLVIISCARLFLSLCVLGLLNLIFAMKYENQVISVFVGVFYILVLELTRIFYVDGFFAYINPGFHAFGIELTNNIVFCFVSDIFYYIIVLLVCLYCVYKIGKKNNIGIRGRK